MTAVVHYLKPDKRGQMDRRAAGAAGRVVMRQTDKRTENLTREGRWTGEQQGQREGQEKQLSEFGSDSC